MNPAAFIHTAWLKAELPVWRRGLFHTGCTSCLLPCLLQVKWASGHYCEQRNVVKATGLIGSYTELWINLSWIIMLHWICNPALSNKSDKSKQDSRGSLQLIFSMQPHLAIQQHASVPQPKCQRPAQPGHWSNSSLLIEQLCGQEAAEPRQHQRYVCTCLTSGH